MFKISWKTEAFIIIYFNDSLMTVKNYIFCLMLIELINIIIISLVVDIIMILKNYFNFLFS